MGGEPWSLDHIMTRCHKGLLPNFSQSSARAIVLHRLLGCLTAWPRNSTAVVEKAENTAGRHKWCGKMKLAQINIQQGRGDAANG